MHACMHAHTHARMIHTHTHTHTSTGGYPDAANDSKRCLLLYKTSPLPFYTLLLLFLPRFLHAICPSTGCLAVEIEI